MSRASDHGPEKKKQAEYALELLLRYACSQMRNNSNNAGFSLAREGGCEWLPSNETNFETIRFNFLPVKGSRAEIHKSDKSIKNQKLANLRLEMGYNLSSDEIVYNDGNCWNPLFRDAIRLELQDFVELVKIKDGRFPTSDHYEFDLFVERINGIQGFWNNNALMNKWVLDNIVEFRKKYDAAKIEFDTEKITKREEERKSKEMLYDDLKDGFKKLNNFLLDFNYSDQLEEIMTLIYQVQGAGVILTEIDGISMQRWLIYRLLHYKPMLIGCSLKHYDYVDFKTNNQTQTFAKIFELKEDQHINKICEEMQDSRKSRMNLFTVSGMDSLPEAELATFLGDFWTSLQAKIAEQGIEDNKCILLLVGNNGWITKHDSCTNSDLGIVTKSQLGWRELDPNCLERWRYSAYENNGDTVGSFLSRCSSLPFNDWKRRIVTTAPHLAIESLCDKFLGSNQITQLDDIWRARLMKDN
jgi:hypothetical protein